MRTKNTQADYIDLVDQLKRIPILQIFDSYVGGKLRHHGKKAVAACPWHGRDSSPSLTLYVDRNNWYCYGCQKGGTVIDMVMVALGVDFKTAVATIARDFGLRTCQIAPEVKKKIQQRQESRNIDVAFEADYERCYLVLLTLKNDIASKLSTYYEFEQNQKLVHTLPILEGIIDELSSAQAQADKLRAWRLARRMLIWLQTMNP
ncbi:DNA primase [Sporomusa ovata DSM 2662]|uniref:DNA primase n=1 Tax=Sporomusa ovata TaxID=2378 RepID=A0A0U1KVK7_9FIRM|nr:CHC2 zinc finger domain-containing protein [Sporomusa ovata]EQB29325.1 DNA primase [Sporomusa ovata DSM 2662]CQR71366.1 DNA primase [Sporomusa ovata]